MRTAGFLKDYCENNDVDTVVIDDSGVGGGVVDRLKETSLRRARVLPFIAGAKALNRDRFYNHAAEVWWLMARAYRSGDMDTDDDAALIGQVSSRRHAYESDRRIRLESKRGMRGSPDEADALAMTFAAPQGGGVRDMGVKESLSKLLADAAAGGQRPRAGRERDGRAGRRWPDRGSKR